MSRNPVSVRKRRHFRRHITFSERIAQAVGDSIQEKCYEIRNLKQLREKLREIVESDEFWSQFDELTKLTKKAQELLNRL